ncbi:MAG: ribonuclease HI family protein [Armatimonadota bacterium]
MNIKSIKIFSDGASSGNPGDAGIGVVLLDEKDETIKEVCSYIGKATNNEAEYRALIRGLREAAKLNIPKIEVYTDSELMAKQINGEYRVKSEQLKPLFDLVIDYLRLFPSYKVEHVIREKNKRADELAKMAIQKYQKGCEGKKG